MNMSYALLVVICEGVGKAVEHMKGMSRHDWIRVGTREVVNFFTFRELFKALDASIALYRAELSCAGAFVKETVKDVAAGAKNAIAKGVQEVVGKTGQEVVLAGIGEKVPVVVAEAEQLAANTAKTAIARDAGVAGVGQQIIKVANMHEFFQTTFGKTIQKYLQKTHIIYKGQSVFEIIQDISKNLQKGYRIYLDSFHKDHLEVFNKRGKFISVLNLDGSLNLEKTASAMNEGRRLIT